MAQNWPALVSGETTFGNLYSVLNDRYETLRTWWAGTSFPSNPTAPQVCIRTDYSPYRIFLYDGTSWEDITDFMPDFVNLETEVHNARGSVSKLRDFLLVAHNEDGTLKSDAPAGSWWMNDADFVEQIASDQFTTNTDKTHIYVPDRPVQATQSSIVYGYVANSNYDSGTDKTTVTVRDMILATDLSGVAYGQEPENMPYGAGTDPDRIPQNKDASGLQWPDAKDAVSYKIVFDGGHFFLEEV